MPKYYRFRATSPTVRKVKRSKDKENEKEYEKSREYKCIEVEVMDSPLPLIDNNTTYDLLTNQWRETLAPRASSFHQSNLYMNYVQVVFVFMSRAVTRVKLDSELNWLELTLACTPAPQWYLRRTAWREIPPLMGVPRQLAAGLRASVQLSNRPIFVFKVPTVRSQDWMRLL